MNEIVPRPAKKRRAKSKKTYKDDRYIKRLRKALKNSLEYFGRARSEEEILHEIGRGELKILISQNSLDRYFALFISSMLLFLGALFIIILIAFGLGLMPSLENGIIPFGIIAIVILGVAIRLFLFGVNLANYNIVLDFQGIYYKKVGKPRFISWSEIREIRAKWNAKLHVIGKDGRIIAFNAASYVPAYIPKAVRNKYKPEQYLFKSRWLDNQIFNRFVQGVNLGRFFYVFEHFKLRTCPFIIDGY